MKTVRSADLSQLPEGAVLLVDIIDGETYKLVLSPGELVSQYVALSSQDTEETEEETQLGMFIMKTLTVGQPMVAMRVPQQLASSEIIWLDKTLRTPNISRIEIYECDSGFIPDETVV